MLELSKLARSTFYYYLQEKIDKYKVEKQEVEEIFYNSKNTYGYRRITLELRQKGYTFNHKTVLKLINVLKIHGKQRRSKYKSYRGEVGNVAPNLLNREFAADAPYTKLTTDVTEFSICNEKVYLSPVLDMYNNELLSYSISLSPNFWQTKEMLDVYLKGYQRQQSLIIKAYQNRVQTQLLRKYPVPAKTMEHLMAKNVFYLKRPQTNYYLRKSLAAKIISKINIPTHLLGTIC